MLVYFEKEPRKPLDEFLITEVPQWLVRQICHSDTIRGPKIPVYTPAHLPGYYHNQYSSKEKEEVPAGTLPENDYRFFEGSARQVTPYQHYATVDYGRCRWCGVWMTSVKERNGHSKKGNCLKLLRVTYDFARTHSKPASCFVCGKATPSERWGIPLCATAECLKSWKFDFWSSHQTFKDAVKKARSLGLFEKLEEPKFAGY